MLVIEPFQKSADGNSPVLFEFPRDRKRKKTEAQRPDLDRGTLRGRTFEVIAL